MKSYLLDTNIVSYWFNASQAQHEPVRRRVGELPTEVVLAVSSVTWGEIEYGHRLNEESSPEREAEFLKFIEESTHMIFDIRKSTRIYYGALRAKLFKKYAPAHRRLKWPEDLLDPTTAKSLKIQENDLWIAAQALEHNFILVSADKMAPIQAVAGEELQVENWSSVGT